MTICGRGNRNILTRVGWLLLVLSLHFSSRCCGQITGISDDFSWEAIWDNGHALMITGYEGSGGVIMIPFAVAPPIPTRRILPEDVVQDSIRSERIQSAALYQLTNNFIVRWTYTETGARKMLAFREAHEGQKTLMVIGAFECNPMWGTSRQTDYAQWKEGWLKSPADKFLGVSEDDAKKIVEGLKIK